MVFPDYWYDLLAVINHCCSGLFLDTFCIKCCRFFPCRFPMPQFLPQQWFGLVWICRFSMISSYFCLRRFALLPGKMVQDCCRFLTILGSKSEFSLLTTPLSVLYLLLLRVWWFIKAISFIWVMILYFLITRPLENSLMLLRKCKYWS